MDGDVVVDVNGVSTAHLDRALAEAPPQVKRDGYAVLRAWRRGDVVTWRIDVEK